MKGKQEKEKEQEEELVIELAAERWFELILATIEFNRKGRANIIKL